MTNIASDIRYAVRTLIRKPAFTAAAVLALALGIGANTAIFSVVNSILLRPLPYRAAERVVMVFETNPSQNIVNGPFSTADFNDLKGQVRSFEKLAAYQNIGFTLLDAQGAESLQGAAVSADFFSVLGIQPELGRGFQAGEDAPQSPLSVLISHSLWQRRFNHDPEIVGKVLNFGGTLHTVIGVMPQGFEFPRKQADVWRNMRLGPATARGPYIMWVMGRIRDGVTADQAREDLTTIATRLQREYPASNAGTTFRPVSIREFLVGDVRKPLYLLLGAVAFVLMIASANVANLLLAKATGREKEVAIRAALGAGRTRLIRQLLIESGVLAAMGGITGLLVAQSAIGIVVAMAPTEIFRIDQVDLDGAALAFTALACIVSGILFGLAPAIQATAVDLITTLKEGGRGNSDSSRKRVRSILIVSEVALSLILLAGAGLTIRSFIQLGSVDPGFDPHNVLAIRMSVSPTKYNSKEKVFAFYTTVMDRVRSLPGVQSVGLTNSLPPIQLDVSDSFTIEGGSSDAQNQPLAAVLIVTPGYFDTMRIAVSSGRAFTAQDRIDSPDVVMISETLAQRYFRNADPVGKRMKIGGAERPNAHWMEIVGVVKDVKYDGLDLANDPAYYLPYAQFPITGQDLVIKTTTDATTLTNTIRNEIRSIDKDVPLGRVTTLETRMVEAVGQPRFRTMLLGAFAIMALLLAGIGIYGVLSYSIGLRTHEIGVRMSLGATRLAVLRMVIGEGMALALTGTAIGIAGAVALTQLMKDVLFQTSPTDPVTFLAVTLVLLSVAFFACLVPARRATRVDPIVALRYE